MEQKKTPYYERVKQSVAFLNHWHGGEPVPDIAVVLGSGLSNAIPDYHKMRSISFSEIPGFEETSVPGHAGELRVGTVQASSSHAKRKKRTIAFLQGRQHAYEGFDPGEVVHNIRTLVSWGVKGVVLTNAAGCLDENWELGRLMFISDHVNLTGLSPLRGDYGKDFGSRFIDMNNCYNHSWQIHLQAMATLMDEPFYTGVYCGVLGPQYETPAEVRMIQSMGAQAIGMSTVLEAIAARQLGVKVAGISCLTNYAAGLSNKALSHQDVVAMGKQFASHMSCMVLNAVLDLNV